MVTKNTIAQDWGLLVARLLLASIFAVSVYGKLTDFAGQVAWVSSMYPAPEILLIIAIILELFGVVSLVLGYETKWGALVLIIFTLAASIMFHIGEGELMDFLKNMGIIGGLLLIMISKPGKYSLN